MNDVKVRGSIELIDYSKGFAIFSIVFFHYFQGSNLGYISKLLSFGGSGIQVFFFLSGFGLALSKNRSLGVFYKRRLMKVLLPYWFVVVIVFLINSNVDHVLYPEDGWYALTGHIFLFKMFDASIVESFGVHFWFISSLIQFYVLFPLLCILKSKFKSRFLLFFAFIISILYMIYICVMGLDGNRCWSCFFLRFLWVFSLGVYCADNYANWKRSIGSINMIIGLLMVAIVSSSVAIYVLRYGPLWVMLNDFFAFIGYGSTMLICYILLRRSVPSFNKIIEWIGKISYEIYLIHMVVGGVVALFAKRCIGMHLNPFVYSFISFAVTVMLAYCFSILLNIYRNKTNYKTS